MLDYRGQFADLLERAAAALAASNELITRLMVRGEGGRSWLSHTAEYLQDKVTEAIHPQPSALDPQPSTPQPLKPQHKPQTRTAATR